MSFQTTCMKIHKNLIDYKFYAQNQCNVAAVALFLLDLRKNGQGTEHEKCICLSKNKRWKQTYRKDMDYKPTK